MVPIFGVVQWYQCFYFGNFFKSPQQKESSCDKYNYIFFGNKVAQSGHIVRKKKLKSPFLYNRCLACCPNIAKFLNFSTFLLNM
jgi:hypothetical protein